MASSGKRKTTMAKITRERRLMERRLDKQARKQARREAAAHGPVLDADGMPVMTEQVEDEFAPERRDEVAPERPAELPPERPEAVAPETPQ